MIKQALQEIVTATEAADALGVSSRTISRICAEHEIGRMVGTVRIMTRKDVSRIDKLRRPPGRPPGKK